MSLFLAGLLSFLGKFKVKVCIYFFIILHVFIESSTEALAIQMHKECVLSTPGLSKQYLGAAFDSAYEEKLILGYRLMPLHCHC